MLTTAVLIVVVGVLGILVGWWMRGVAQPEPEQLVRVVHSPLPPVASSPPVAPLVPAPQPVSHRVILCDGASGREILTMKVVKRARRLFHAGMAWDHFDTDADTGHWKYHPVGKLDQLTRRRMRDTSAL
jgi:hypothetical protein